MGPGQQTPNSAVRSARHASCVTAYSGTTTTVVGSRYAWGHGSRNRTGGRRTRCEGATWTASAWDPAVPAYAVLFESPYLQGLEQSLLLVQQPPGGNGRQVENSDSHESHRSFCDGGQGRGRHRPAGCYGSTSRGVGCPTAGRQFRLPVAAKKSTWCTQTMLTRGFHDRVIYSCLCTCSG